MRCISNDGRITTPFRIAGFQEEGGVGVTFSQGESTLHLQKVVFLVGVLTLRHPVERRSRRRKKHDVSEKSQEKKKNMSQRKII